jgi:hypothetical protein
MPRRYRDQSSGDDSACQHVCFALIGLCMKNFSDLNAEGADS